MAESQSQEFIYKAPPQLGVSACYGFVFVHLCLLSSCQHTHTHTLVSVLMPVSLPSRAGPSCPRICPLPLCRPVRHGDVTDGNELPFGSICHRGRPSVAHYAALMRADSDPPPPLPAEPLIKAELRVPDQCAAVRGASGPPSQLLSFYESFVFD